MGKVIDIKDILNDVTIDNLIDDIKSKGNEQLAAILQDAAALAQSGEEVKMYAGMVLVASLINGIVDLYENEKGYSYKDIDPDWFPATKVMALVK